MLHYIVWWKFTDVLEVLIASVIMQNMNYQYGVTFRINSEADAALLNYFPANVSP
jgi:hypothetical protein